MKSDNLPGLPSLGPILYPFLISWPILGICRMGGICSLAMTPFPGHTLRQKNSPSLSVSTLGTVLRPFYSVSEPQLSHSQSHLKPQVMVDREDPQSPRTFWSGSMCVRLCLPGPCWAGVFSKTAFCSGFHLGRKGLNHPCSFPSTFRVLGSGKHFMCSPCPGTGTWVGLYSDSLSNV